MYDDQETYFAGLIQFIQDVDPGVSRADNRVGGVIAQLRAPFARPELCCISASF